MAVERRVPLGFVACTMGKLVRGFAGAVVGVDEVCWSGCTTEGSTAKVANAIKSSSGIGDASSFPSEKATRRKKEFFQWQ